MRLLDARKTLDEHRRLLVVGGWFSLIAATLYVDLGQQAAANSWLATAASLAQQAGQDEIYAWRYETEAWQVLIDGDYHRAVQLSQAAQRFAPRGSSAAIQATAQEGRAWARLGQARETYDALNRVERFVSRMTRPETPEHTGAPLPLRPAQGRSLCRDHACVARRCSVRAPCPPCGRHADARSRGWSLAAPTCLSQHRSIPCTVTD